MKFDSHSNEVFPNQLWQWAWLVLLLSFSTFIRLNGVSDFYYSSDETTYLGIVQGKTLQDVWNYAHYEANPPLIYILLRYWLMVSDNPRYLSLILGGMLIIIHYFIGRKLGGHLMGMCCATLIAVSNGCIIQSSVVRQYILLLVCLSCAYYFYTIWKDSRKPAALLAYVICGWLSVLSHYSASLFFLYLTAFECCLLVKATKWKTLTYWTIANTATFVVFAAMYVSWLPIISALETYLSQYTIPEGMYPLYVLSYPFAVSGYIFPNLIIGGAIFLSALVIMWKRPTFYTGNPAMIGSFKLAGFALLMGILLYATRIYPPLGTRRNLWLLPFLIPPAGWLMVSGLRYYITPLSQRFYFIICAVLLMGSVFFLYDKELRFRDGSEYVITQDIHKKIMDYMHTLGSKDIIITEKDDAVFLTNVYPALTHDKANMAATLPYLQTGILLNPYYPRFYNREIFLSTLRQALKQKMFEGKERLIFYHMVWSRSPLPDLILCDTLKKQILTFPSRNNAMTLTRKDILRTSIVIMILDAKEFITQVLSENGSTAACMDGRHDQTTVNGPANSPAYEAD